MGDDFVWVVREEDIEKTDDIHKRSYRVIVRLYQNLIVQNMDDERQFLQADAPKLEEMIGDRRYISLREIPDHQINVMKVRPYILHFKTNLTLLLKSITDNVKAEEDVVSALLS